MIVWLLRVAYPFVLWLDRKFGREPHFAERWRQERKWEYEQADRQSWDNEPDRTGLTEALTLNLTNPDGAHALLLALAHSGSPRATNALGEHYLFGRGAPKDAKEAEAWFKRAFELGSRRGLLNYGRALYRRRDFDAATAVFERGAAEDWSPALFWLARSEVLRLGLRRGKGRVKRLLERAAEQGHVSAGSYLGAMMAFGVFGLRHILEGIRLTASEDTFHPTPVQPLSALERTYH